ncbi:hypothetical protein [Paenibacillus periandrae]|uniref:hypothetical protein n=1 Tax=Paenibacillus periandrae TaxID=1761741 RepID=UPI001F09FE0E|nr:hypothetical protein [Paenibacillus periandrae]
MNEPDLNGINQLESGVLVQTYICILAMINYGTPEEKQRAKKKLVELEPLIAMHVNRNAFRYAISSLDWQAEEVKLLNGF